ncbi:hypothetical protein NDU88_006059 [Pleurodeles waltl]|uniref:Uncharacterized protein n=1 Tax=Pleurodeles waltl TaxID=8319 RepID=A0AAV7WX23_PLEWA|nr:hypothetical protein NDU88_006059 [Pleurodeles waltl]
MRHGDSPVVTSGSFGKKDYCGCLLVAWDLWAGTNRNALPGDVGLGKALRTITGGEERTEDLTATTEGVAATPETPASPQDAAAAPEPASIAPGRSGSTETTGIASGRSGSTGITSDAPGRSSRPECRTPELRPRSGESVASAVPPVSPPVRKNRKNEHQMNKDRTTEHIINNHPSH